MTKPVINKICWGLSGALVCAYLFIVYQNTLNIPHPGGDDFFVFFKFLSDFIQSNSLSEKFSLIFSQHGEHRLLLTRLIVLLGYWITGKVSMSALVVIGNLFLLGISALFVMLVKPRENIPMASLLVVALLFNGQNLETGTWAMASIANVGTLLLTMLSIYFVSQTSTRCFVAGLALSVVAIFSNGNGLFLFPALSFSLYLQKRRKELIWFALITGTMVACYLIGYTPPYGKISLLEVISSIHVRAVDFFCFIGCNLWLPSLKIIPFLWGLLIFLTYVLAFYLKYYKKNIAWFSFFTVMLLTAVAVALNRSLEVCPLRFRIYGCMFSILTVIFYCNNKDLLRLKYLGFSVMPIVVFSVFCTILYYNRLQIYVETQKVSTHNWQHSKEVALFPSKNKYLYIDILSSAESLKIYTMPKIPLPEMVSEVKVNGEKWQDLSSPVRYGVDYITEQEGFLLIKGWAYLQSSTMNFMDISIWLLRGDIHIKIDPYTERRDDVIPDLSKVNCGFFAVIPQNIIPPGDYELGVMLQRKYTWWTAKTFSKSTGVKITHR